ncbi:class I SAM-dependent methyltransferase [Scytonema sp. PRP1]|uniref:class I SAM-dependent methyltransferase n=1 Tax=Scytonema sp. PRP1 TaxID=3120513 RepID=UPI002FCF7A9D
MLQEVDIKKYKQQLLTDFNSRTHYDQGRFYTPIGDRLIEFAKLQSGQTILDIATGTGIVALNAAKIVGDAGKVIGVDISSGMLSYAKQKLATEGLKNVNFQEADAEKLTFTANSFDVILCSLAICYLTDIPTALRQWHRFLKASGILAFNAWAETAFPPSVLFREVAQRYGVKVSNPNEPLGTVERCHNVLQEAGFKNIEVTQEQFGWYFTPDAQTAEELWKMNSKNVFGYQVLQLSPNQLEQCKAEYISEIQALPMTKQGVWCDAPIFFVLAYK